MNYKYLPTAIKAEKIIKEIIEKTQDMRQEIGNDEEYIQVILMGLSDHIMNDVNNYPRRDLVALACAFLAQNVEEIIKSEHN